MELLRPLDDWIDFSAWLAAPEFECLWRSILTRMRRDWGEPYMADYLEKNILVLSSNRKAMWRCAYDCCPLGFTTYAVNCRRALKCLLDPSIKWANCGQLMIEVAAAVTSKFDKGDWRMRLRVTVSLALAAACLINGD